MAIQNVTTIPGIDCAVMPNQHAYQSSTSITTQINYRLIFSMYQPIQVFADVEVQECVLDGEIVNPGGTGYVGLYYYNQADGKLELKVEWSGALATGQPVFSNPSATTLTTGTYFSTIFTPYTGTSYTWNQRDFINNTTGQVYFWDPENDWRASAGKWSRFYYNSPGNTPLTALPAEILYADLTFDTNAAAFIAPHIIIQ